MFTSGGSTHTGHGEERGHGNASLYIGFSNHTSGSRSRQDRAGDSNRHNRQSKRRTPMINGKYGCPLTRYKSKPLPPECKTIMFDTAQEALYVLTILLFHADWE